MTGKVSGTIETGEPDVLNEFQIGRVWDNMLAAETRALYFADLASRYTRRKQWITGVSFFLSSGAAATLIGKAPPWVPIVLSIIVSVASAYSLTMRRTRPTPVRPS